MCRRPRISNGFTIVEVLIVVLIIGVLVAITVPKFNGSSRKYRIEMAAQKLAADLERAGVFARAQSKSVTISFATNDLANGNRYFTTDLVSSRSTLKTFEVSLDEAASLDEAPSQVVVDVYGNPDSDCEFTLNKGTPYQRTVLFFQATGQAAVQ